MQEPKRIVNRYFNPKTLLSVLVAVVLALIVLFVINGSDFVPRLKELSFWAVVAANVVVVLFAFNYVKPAAVLAEMQKEEHKEAKTRYKSLVSFSKQHFLQPKIEKSIEEENKKRLENAMQTLLNNITYDFTIEEARVITKSELKALSKEKRLSIIQKRKLKRAVKKVRNGKAKYEHFTMSDLMNTQGFNLTTGDNEIKISVVKMSLRENLVKLINYVTGFIFFQSLIWKGINPQFWATLAVQAWMVFTSAFSGMSAARKRVERINIILSNRSDFISQAIKDDLIEFNNKN